MFHLVWFGYTPSTVNYRLFIYTFIYTASLNPLSFVPFTSSPHRSLLQVHYSPLVSAIHMLFPIIYYGHIDYRVERLKHTANLPHPFSPRANVLKHNYLLCFISHAPLTLHFLSSLIHPAAENHSWQKPTHPSTHNPSIIPSHAQTSSRTAPTRSN